MTAKHKATSHHKHETQDAPPESPVGESQPEPAPAPVPKRDLAIEHRTAREALNRAAVHIVDALQLAFERMKKAGAPSEMDIEHMDVLRESLESAVSQVSMLSPKR